LKWAVLLNPGVPAPETFAHEHNPGESRVHAELQQSGRFALSAAPWRRLPPTERQALVSTGLVAVVVCTLFVLTYLGLDALTAVRAYVNGEGLWSKAQKMAVADLERFARSEDPDDFESFLNNLAVTLGDRQARLELERPEPDMERVTDGFLTGGNHPDDIDRMAIFFRRFRDISYVDSAIAIWARADEKIDALLEMGDSLRNELLRLSPNQARVSRLLDRTRELDAELTDLERAFSTTLSEGARWARQMLITLMGGTGALLLVISGLVSRASARRIQRSEALLRRSEETQRHVLDTIEDGYYETDLHGTMTAVNPSLSRILGRPRSALVGKASHTFFAPRSGRDVRRADKEDGRFVAEVTRPDGSRRITETSVSTLTDGGDGDPVGYCGVVRDITDRLRQEEALYHAQKLQAVGQLTGGIAHDLNNLLTVIASTADLIAADLPEESASARADVDEMKSAAARGADMIRKLLAFSRRGTLDFAPIDLSALIRRTADTLRHVLPAKIVIRANLPDPVWVRADAGALEQVLHNLATNARDAMPAGGTLTLETREIDADAAFVQARGTGEPGRYAELLVSDTGTGMDAATRNRIFEPFFTTKPQGSGIGLGMAMIYGIVRQHEGFIDLESEPGHGTTLRLYLPVATPASPGEKRPARTRGGSETILLVEDEPAILETGRRILERYGYTVLTASDGEHALERIQTDGKEIDLVLTDVVMPRMGGRALYEAARELGHPIRFLFTSGYTERDMGDMLEPHMPLVAKPWTADELLNRVRRSLDEAPLNGS
jgi:PAS domain S-box-containing protein